MSTTIWDEVIDGNIAGVRRLLENVNVRNGIGETPLHLAARHGLEEMAEVLIDAGASLHVKDWESGWTPLHRSLYFGHIRLSLLLLQAGARMDGSRDQPHGRQKYRPRSRSESRGLHNEGASSGAVGARRRNDSLGDDEGNSPLDVLSLELRPQLKAARESGLGGDVYSFGKADFTLGYDSFGRADVILPRRVEALANLQIIRVAASKHHSAAITKCGRLYTWGHGKSGRLGHGNEHVCMMPTRVEGLAHQKVTDVATAESHTAALTSDGELYSWGRDRFGQLGHGSGSNGRLAPKRVESLKKVTVVGVAAGSEHTVVVTRSGNCYTFGRNNHGQLGLAGVKETRSPRVVSGISSGASRGAGGVGRHIFKVSASARSTVVVTRGIDKGSGLQPVDEVFCWGLGSHVPTRINFNNAKDAASPTRWQTHDARIDIVDVVAARCHNIALDRIGRVFSWGFGADNLGLDPRETRTERGPKLVAAMLPENCGGNPVHISASDQHTCVVTDTGDLFTWGTSGESGALGHGDERWQPVAKRVPSLKKVVSVAAAHDHTVVLCAASCPPLPHGASLTPVDATSGAYIDDDHALAEGEEGEEGEEGDEDSEVDEEETKAHGLAAHGGPFTTNSAGQFEPLTLKQMCEAKLAQNVDLHNAGAMLAYADALDAPALTRFCADFVSANLDGILVMGRESDRCCLLEASTSRALASSSLCGARARVPMTRHTASTTEPVDVPAHEEEGLDLRLQATALARAEMRSNTPSAKVAARAVRSLKKKLARIREWELAKESGKEISSEQVSKLNQKARMEAELTSLDSQLERAKMTHAVRCSRLEAGKMDKTETFHGSKTPEVKRALFPDESDTDDRRHPALHPALHANRMGHWTPQLDLSHDETKANDKRPIICEACSVKCTNANMYADHLRGKRHRATTLRLEQQLQREAQSDKAQVPRTWTKVSAVPDRCATAAAAPPAVARSSALPAGANLPESDKGRRASCPEANLPSRSSQARGSLNQLPRRRDAVTMREVLEDQQKAATIYMADTSKEETTTEAQAMAVLGISANSAPRGGSQRLLSQRLPSQQDVPTPAVYSLVDFIATPGNKKLTQRMKDSQKVGKVWGGEVFAPENPVNPAERVAEVPRRSGKSFHEILQEEERDKEQREEYGESVWFVSGKPRSTSFEGIVEQQRREERVAEEERLRQLEEEMLGLALEMSRQEAESQATSHNGKGNRAGRRARHRQEVGGDAERKKRSSTQRMHRTARAEGCSEISGGVGASDAHSRNGRSRRSKRTTSGLDQAEQKIGTSPP